jgi:hypothetical protein
MVYCRGETKPQRKKEPQARASDSLHSNAGRRMTLGDVINQNRADKDKRDNLRSGELRMVQE